MYKSSSIAQARRYAALTIDAHLLQPPIGHSPRWCEELGSNRKFVLKHGGSQLTPFAKRQRAGVGGEHLDANVVGAGGVMLANTISDCSEITPSDDRVDQPVTAAIPEIVFVESEP